MVKSRKWTSFVEYFPSSWPGLRHGGAEKSVHGWRRCECAEQQEAPVHAIAADLCGVPVSRHGSSSAVSEPSGHPVTEAPARLIRSPGLRLPDGGLDLLLHLVDAEAGAL